MTRITLFDQEDGEVIPGSQIAPRKDFRVYAPTVNDARRTLMEHAVAPSTAAARAIGAIEAKTPIDWNLDVLELAACLQEQAVAITSGDLSRAEAMLINQATVLQSLFTRQLEKALAQENWPQFEAHMRFAMKAQSQCRQTLETLGNIKNPPIVYARQANIAQGHQQVNYGPGAPTFPAQGSSRSRTRTRARARAENFQTEQSKLLESNNGQRMDAGTQSETIHADSTVEAVAPIDRTKNRRR